MAITLSCPDCGGTMRDSEADVIECVECLGRIEIVPQIEHTYCRLVHHGGLIRCVKHRPTKPWWWRFRGRQYDGQDGAEC